jgi:hypothetical protein
MTVKMVDRVRVRKAEKFNGINWLTTQCNANQSPVAITGKNTGKIRVRAQLIATYTPLVSIPRGFLPLGASKNNRERNPNYRERHLQKQGKSLRH